MPLQHLWATWRSNYINSVRDSRGGDGRSLFERILAALDDSGEADRDTGIVARGDDCFVLLNRFPYTAGHLMVLPNVAVAELDQLDAAVHTELWELVRTSVTALQAAFGCDGINIGVNLGEAAGGSQSDHLHVHCVPRWIGDTNFIGVSSETRVLPIGLDEAWDRLRAVWPSDVGSAHG